MDHMRWTELVPGRSLLEWIVVRIEEYRNRTTLRVLHGTFIHYNNRIHPITPKDSSTKNANESMWYCCFFFSKITPKKNVKHFNEESFKETGKNAKFSVKNNISSKLNQRTSNRHVKVINSTLLLSHKGPFGECNFSFYASTWDSNYESKMSF